MRRLIWTLAAVVAAGVFLFWLAPGAPIDVDTSGWSALAARTVPGAYHVHTTRSDGHGDKPAIAQAAARARLKFVILTDHGDGTRPPDPPEYIDGVLMLDGVEISTAEGHLVAIDMPRAPYPLGGRAESVLEDVRRLGGFGIAAHPDSPKAALRWTDARSALDGIEWLNADSEWRDERRRTLVRAGLGYFLRQAPALATLLDRPSTLVRWDDLSVSRKIVAFAAADAHGGAGRRAEDATRTLYSTIGIPGYEASFREMSNRVVLDRPLGGDPAVDARAVLTAIRRGSVFSVIDAVASPALLDFHAVPSGATVTLRARATLPRGATIVLFQNGREVSRSAGELRHEAAATAAGVFRVEVDVPGAPGGPRVPWLVSNGIYLGASGPVAPGTSAPSTQHGAPGAGAAIPPFPWRIDKDPASTAIVRTADTSAQLEYRLADGERRSQFVALATDLDGGTLSAIDLGLKADRPARISVQVRTASGRRWGRSYYVDPAGSAIHARLADFHAIGAEDPTASFSAQETVTSLLLVVDLTNAAPGRSGRLTVLSSALVK